jgi:hypothetical protein
VTLDVAASLAFLRWLTPSGPYSVGAIDSDDASHGLSWLTTDDLSVVEAFVRENDARKWNLYYQIGTCRPDLGAQRAAKQHVVVVNALHADMDPPTVPDLNALATWQHTVAANAANPHTWAALKLPVPSAIIFSGSGFQFLWKLAEPLVLWRALDGGLEQDPELVALVEDRNYAVLGIVDPGHPGTHNVDRLLRLPGTANYPSRTKREKYGRFEPVVTFAVTTDATHDLAVFPAMTAPVPKVMRHIAVNYALSAKELVERGITEVTLNHVIHGAPIGADRSVFAFSVACRLLREGLSEEDLAAVLGNDEFAISAHYLDQNDPDRAVSRAVSAARLEVDPVKEAMNKSFYRAMRAAYERVKTTPAERVAPQGSVFDRVGVHVVDRSFK